MFGGLGLRPRRRHLHHALHCAGHRTGDHRIETLGGVAQRSPQHRHVDPGDHFDLHAVGKPLRDVAGRRPKTSVNTMASGLRTRASISRACASITSTGVSAATSSASSAQLQSGKACCATCFSDDASGACAMIINPGMAADYRQFVRWN
jgi:hypothetical protein